VVVVGGGSTGSSRVGGEATLTIEVITDTCLYYT